MSRNDGVIRSFQYLTSFETSIACRHYCKEYWNIRSDKIPIDLSSKKRKLYHLKWSVRIFIVLDYYRRLNEQTKRNIPSNGYKK